MLDDRKFIVRQKAEIPPKYIGRKGGGKKISSPLTMAAAELEVGESFIAGPATKASRSYISVMVSNKRPSLQGKKFTTRKEGGNVAVWRVE